MTTNEPERPAKVGSSPPPSISIYAAQMGFSEKGNQQGSQAGEHSSASLCSTDYAYASIEEFEEIVGYKVNDAFKDGWRMARTTNAMLGILSNVRDDRQLPAALPPMAGSAISDTDRLDWLQTHQKTAWRVTHDEWEQTTETRTRHIKTTNFDGWVVNEQDEPKKDIRAAIDSAIHSQNR